MHVAFGVFAWVFLRVRRKSRKARKTQRTRNEEIFFGQHPSRTKGSVEVRGAFSAFSAIQTEKRSELPNYSKTRNCLYTHKMARIL